MSNEVITRINDLRREIEVAPAADVPRLLHDLKNLIAVAYPPRRIVLHDPVDGTPWYIDITGAPSDDGRDWSWTGVAAGHADDTYQYSFASASEAEQAAREWFQIRDLGECTSPVDALSFIPLPKSHGWFRVRLPRSLKYPHGREVVGRTWHVARALRGLAGGTRTSSETSPVAGGCRHRDDQQQDKTGRVARQDKCIISITPLDMGFDVRVLGMAVRIPDWITGLRLMKRDGKIHTIHGTREELLAAAREAGYAVI